MAIGAEEAFHGGATEGVQGGDERGQNAQCTAWLMRFRVMGKGFFHGGWMFSAKLATFWDRGKCADCSASHEGRNSVTRWAGGALPGFGHEGFRACMHAHYAIQCNHVFCCHSVSFGKGREVQKVVRLFFTRLRLVRKSPRLV